MLGSRRVIGENCPNKPDSASVTMQNRPERYCVESNKPIIQKIRSRTASNYFLWVYTIPCLFSLV